MKAEIKEFLGDYALNVEYAPDYKLTIFFNSHHNALMVKRIMEVDGSVPNVATVADVVEVVRCKNCMFWDYRGRRRGVCTPPSPALGGYCARRGATGADDFCSFGKRRVLSDEKDEHGGKEKFGAISTFVFMKSL